MNIIKLVDKIMPNDLPQADLFNKYLRGKYAYWVQMRYIVPMGLYEENGQLIGMKHEGYVACEEDITKLLMKEDGSYKKPYGSPNIDVYEPYMMDYVDAIETDRINSTKEFRLKNEYVPDNDITIDELKLFRTWLAKEIISLDTDEWGKQKYLYFNELDFHMLKYYAQEMYNETIKILSDFGTNQVVYNEYKTGCGCGSGTNLSSLYNTQLSICDPISIYRKNLYLKMVELFSKIEFWTQWPKEFILTFKNYIDNIIKLNLPLSNSEFIESFKDCTCINKSNQDILMDILKRLSLSLDYIANNDITGHKNYIGDALKDWSSKLYENMQW